MKLLARVAAWGRRRLRACLVARTGPHRATLMHHFLSDACRVLPSETVTIVCGADCLCLAPLASHHCACSHHCGASVAPQMPSDQTTRRRRRRLRRSHVEEAEPTVFRSAPPHCLTHHFLSDACIVALRDATARFQERRRRLRHQQGDR